MNGVTLEGVGVNINNRNNRNQRRPIESFDRVFTSMPIDQFKDITKTSVNDLPEGTVNRYYYAISKEYHPTTGEYTPRLFIIYITDNGFSNTTYKIVYIRTNDNEWHKQKRGGLITKGHRKMINEFNIYDISREGLISNNSGPIYVPSWNVLPPTFEYSGGRRRTRRSVKRRLRSKRSRCRKYVM